MDIPTPTPLPESGQEPGKNPTQEFNNYDKRYYMSRIELNPASSKVHRMKKDHAFTHRYLTHMFESRVLYRLETVNDSIVLYLYTDRLRPLTAIQKDIGLPGKKPDSVPMDKILQTIKKGAMYYYRIKISCQRSIQVDGKYKRIHVREPEKIIEFIQLKGKKYGFDIHPEIIDLKDNIYETFKKPNGNIIPHPHVTISGILTVTDPELFKTAVIQGIGLNKCYGCGLLTIRPLNQQLLKDMR